MARKSELPLLLLFVLGGVGIAMVSGAWLLALLAALGAYISFLWFRLYRLHDWLQSGMNMDDIPETSGVFDSMYNDFYRYHREIMRLRKKNKKLLYQFNNIVSSLPDATLILNKYDEIQWMNKHAAQMFHLHRKRDMHAKLTNLVRIPRLTNLLHSPSPREVVMRLPWQEELYIAVRVSPLQKNTRILTARDVSEKHRLEESQQIFFANASHELRTPLTIISGYLQMLDDYPDLPAISRDYVSKALGQTLRMTDLVNDILGLAILDNKGLDITDSDPIRPADLLTEMLPAYQQTHPHFSFDIDLDTRLTINAIQKELYSLIDNLISNALRYSEGSRISICWQETKHQACLSVRDNGKGIPEEHVAHLTERFYRVDESRSRQTGGTGLGLTIVNHIAQRHGATLSINSKPGEYTDIQVCFSHYWHDEEDSP
jgi:two-component system, OmpR family, phosphate regulon sensor histidine kinase PhoR